MKRTLLLVICLVLLILPALFITTNEVLALPSGILTNAEASDNKTTLEDTFNNLFNNILSIIPKTIELIINIILAPFKALQTIFEKWADTLGGWAGPIIAAFVIIVILFMIRIYSQIDQAMDRVGDWISGEND